MVPNQFSTYLSRQYICGVPLFCTLRPLNSQHFHSYLPLLQFPSSLTKSSCTLNFHVCRGRQKRDETVGRTTLTPTPSVSFPHSYLAPPSCFISLLWTHAAFFFRQRETLESTSDIFPPPPPLPPTFRGRRVQPYVLPIIDQWPLPPPAAGW